MTANLKEYGIELHAKLSAAWELARKAVKQAQRRQKDHYDRHATPTLPFREGERVFLYKPGEKTGEARKLARPFHGPYRVREGRTRLPLFVSTARKKNRCWCNSTGCGVVQESWVMNSGRLTREGNVSETQLTLYLHPLTLVEMVRRLPQTTAG